MSSVKFLLSGFVLVHAIFLQSHPVVCDEEEDNLLQGINSYRKSLNLPQLAKNDKAMCLADKLADKIEDQPCSATYGANTLPGVGLQSSSYQDALSKCKINPNSTTDGVILPVCVPKLVPTLVLTNYTRTTYQKYLNGSRFTGAGLGSEDDWMVLVLATSTPGGSFAGGAAAALLGGGSGILWVGMLLGLLMTH
ncbi:uncharacterized GPI-anchored protein At5g19250 [Rhodamnia argentea]|uniref:Uncharacterized GPI-anchored protein At5g19250 n=1 Tax=Rhodamnia argentea TaxID=178133 RepID=A0ABM3HIJ7_9MYRT|nr:uncharacterized GPI-anchored protein At5g19250 [Rhodamnia argentea]